MGPHSALPGLRSPGNPRDHPHCLLTAVLDDNYFRWSQRDSKPFLLKMTELTTKPSHQMCPALPSLTRCLVQQMPCSQKPGGRTCQPSLGAPSEPTSEGHTAHGTRSDSTQHPCKGNMFPAQSQMHPLCEGKAHPQTCCCPAPSSSAECK